MSRLSYWLGIAFVLSAPSFAAHAQDLSQPRIMLVLDGSSSMWTRIEGDRSKIEVARESIADLVGGWESTMEFGITTYGHREASNCQDIETVLPVAALDSEQVADVVNRISPRGKTPLAAALRQAAEALDYKNQPAKILLVSDGIENCGQDPCQTVKELAAQAKDLEVDVIGFDMNNHEMGQLECIAINAAGHMVQANMSAFSETVNESMTAATTGDGREGNLSLSTTLVNKPITEGVRYIIYRHEEDGSSSPKVTESMSPAVTLRLPAGRYLIEALRGDGAGTLSKCIEIDLDDGANLEHVFRLAEFRPPSR